MYEQFYGLKEKPFAILPDASYLYLSRGHKTALTMLRYSLVSRQGFTLITGEVGSGKTTLINQLLNEMEDDVTVGLINFTGSDYEDLAEWIMMAFGLEYAGMTKAQLYDAFVQFLIKQYATGKRTVLIVDEAQNMEARGLENVRMLSNVNAQKDYLLHLILVGQPELKELMQKPELRQLKQRISVAYHLGKLPLDEVGAYIKHRLGVAGGNPELFTPAAVELIAEASKGVPRIINTICDMAMVYGFSDKSERIDAALVSSVLSDRKEMGLEEERMGFPLPSQAGRVTI